MLTKKMLIASAMLVVGSIYAQDIELKTVESWGNPKNVKSVEDEILEVSGRNVLFSSTTFKIDPAKTYKISGKLRQVAGENNLSYVGFIVSDGKKRDLSPFNFNAIVGTDTELVEDVKSTDTTLKVKDASKWVKRATHYRVALNTADDYSDLPNFSYINQEITKVEKDGDVWVVTIDKPGEKDAKAGSKVRLHGGGAYIYSGGIHNLSAGYDWKEFSGSIKGYGKYGYSAFNAWPPGAVYARVILLANYNSPVNFSPVLQLKDIKVEVID